MSQPFDLCVMPGSVLVGLIEKLDVQVDEACLFSPLLTGKFAPADNEELANLLTPHGLWENGQPTEDARRAIRAVAMPRKEYEIKWNNSERSLRFFAYSNSKDVTIASYGINDGWKNIPGENESGSCMRHLNI